MLKTRAAFATVIPCLFLSACGGGSGISDAAPQANSYNAETTLVAEAGMEPLLSSAYLTADPTLARFNTPMGLELDRSGNLYVADSNNYTIRKIARNGVVTTLAGLAGAAGSADGAGSAARFAAPSDLAVDRVGNVYVTDRDVVRKITPAGLVTTIAGTAGQRGYVDATGTAARFNSLRGIAVDKEFNLYVADVLNARIRKITPDGVVTTLAGGFSGAASIVDGVGARASFDSPSGLTIDRHGRLYVTDQAWHTGIPYRGSTFIRRIDTRTAAVVTLAGNYGLAMDPMPGIHEGVTQFSQASGIAVDHGGNIFVADNFNNRGRVQRISTDGQIATVTTYPESGRAVYDVSTQWQGNLFVSESSFHVIDRITPAYDVAPYAGKAGEAGNVDTP